MSARRKVRYKPNKLKFQTAIVRICENAWIILETGSTASNCQYKSSYGIGMLPTE